MYLSRQASSSHHQIVIWICFCIKKKVKVLRRQCDLYLSRLSCCVFCICLLTNKIQMQISWVGRSTRCIYICRTIYVNLDKSASQWNPSYDSYYESGKWKIFRFRVFTMGHEKIFKAKQSFCGRSKEVSIECSSIEGHFKQWHSFTHFASLLFLASVSLIHSLFLASVSLIH